MCNQTDGDRATSKFHGLGNNGSRRRTDVHHRNAFIVRFGRLHNEPLYTNANFHDEEINALLGGIVCHYRRNTVSNKKMNGILKKLFQS